MFVAQSLDGLRQPCFYSHAPNKAACRNVAEFTVQYVKVFFILSSDEEIFSFIDLSCDAADVMSESPRLRVSV